MFDIRKIQETIIYKSVEAESNAGILEDYEELLLEKRIDVIMEADGSDSLSSGWINGFLPR